MEISRRLAVYGFAASKAIDNCIKGKYKTDQVLVARSGSQCGSPRYLFATVAEEGSIHPSTLEINTAGSSSVQRTASRRGNFDYPSMADAILVADGNAISTQEVPPNANSHARKVVESHRMEVIATRYRKQGLTEETIILLKGCTRKKIRRMYDLAWDQWRKFCRVEDYNPCEYNVKAVLSFLVKNKNYSWSQLNIFRSAIQSVYTVIHPAKPTLSRQSFIKHFFLARKKSQVKVLKTKDLKTWDISIVLNTVRAWGPSARFTLQQLQIKTIVLLTLATIARPRSDIGRLQFRDVQLLPEGVSCFFREPKECQEKMSHLGRINDQTICPVFNLELFLERSTHRREGLPEDHTLFLAYIDHPKKQSCSIGEKTLAKWLKDVLEEAGTDTTEYTAHSYGAAAATKTIQQGAPIELVKKHANWSLNGNTLEKYYYKSFDQHRMATDMVEKKFSSQAEKGTTSGAETETTTIMVGAIHNINVAGAKTKDVVWSHP
jgi:hypothetical protein